MRKERNIFQLFEQSPHPNIAESVDIGYPEGIYLRRYLQRSQLGTPAQSDRILWYRDILRGLVHLHSLGVAHADLRIDNVLFTAQSRAVICDFSASAPFGQPNPAFPQLDRNVSINGLAETVSDTSDLFAMASLMFHLETGARPVLSVHDDDTILTPRVNTGHPGIDSIITKA